MNIDPRNDSCFGRDLKVATKVRVATLTLTELLRQERLENLDLLKLDLQGAERLVLCASEKELMRIRVIYTEVFFERLYAGAWLFWEMNEFLSCTWIQTLWHFQRCPRAEWRPLASERDLPPDEARRP